MHHVRLVRWRRRQAVHQPALRVHPDVRLHPEVPRLALPPLPHLRVALPLAVLRGARRLNEARVHQRPRAQARPALRQHRVDPIEQRLPEVRPLKPAPEVQDRRLVQQGLDAQSREPPGRVRLVQEVLHVPVAQVPCQLHDVHPKHRAQRVRTPAVARIRVVRLDDRL